MFKNYQKLLIIIAVILAVLATGVVFGYEAITLHIHGNIVASGNLRIYDSADMKTEIRDLEFGDAAGNIIRGDTYTRDLWISNPTEDELTVTIDSTMVGWQQLSFDLLPGHYWKGQLWVIVPWSYPVGEFSENVTIQGIKVSS